MNYRIGDLISFTYPAVHQQGTKAHDKFPNVLVLHPNWKNNLHGLNFNYLTDDEINALRMIIDPGFELKYAENLQKKNPNLMRELDRIVLKMGNSNITSPHDFYLRVIRPFIIVRGWDPYRRYRPDKMTNIRIVQKREIITGEQKASIFGTSNLRDRGKNEKDILKNLAQASVAEEESYGRGVLTPQERRFIGRLRGSALKLFDDYVQKFQYANGPRFK